MGILGLIWSMAAVASEHQLDVGILTDVPVMIGANATYETPFRMRAELNLGRMPGGYVDLINDSMTGFEVYSEDVAYLIDVAVRRSFVGRFELGYRPLPKRGLVFSGGFQWLMLGGDTADAQVITGRIEDDLSAFVQDATGDVDLTVQPKMLVGEVGYEWVVKERVVLRSTLGFAYTVSSSTKVAPTKAPATPAQEVLMDGVSALSEDYLTYVFEEWVHVPMVGLGVAWRFGG